LKMRFVSDQRAGSGDGGDGADETEGVRGGAVVVSLDMFAVVVLRLAEEMASFSVRAFYCCMSDAGRRRSSQRARKWMSKKCSLSRAAEAPAGSGRAIQSRPVQSSIVFVSHLLCGGLIQAKVLPQFTFGKRAIKVCPRAAGASLFL
jgi:hypothetical protein